MLTEINTTQSKPDSFITPQSAACRDKRESACL